MAATAPQRPPWVSENSWKALQYAEATVAALEGLSASVSASASEWETWAASAEPHAEPLPASWDEKLPAASFAKLCVIRVFREEKLIFACSAYVGLKLGAEFTEPAAWTLDDVFPDTNCRTPVIFILSTGEELMFEWALEPVSLYAPSQPLVGAFGLHLHRNLFQPAAQTQCAGNLKGPSPPFSPPSPRLIIIPSTSLLKVFGD